MTVSQYKKYPFDLLSSLRSCFCFSNVVNALLAISMLSIHHASTAESDPYVNMRYLSSHGLSMFDDLKYEDGFSHFDYVNPNATKGGSIKLGTSTSFDNFNPFIRKGVSPTGLNYFGGLVYDSLTVSSDDEPFSLYGLVAERIYLAPDRKSITYFINPKAKFHDGKPITADDVVFSLDILKEKGVPLFKYYYQEISHAEKIRDHIVTFHLTNPDNGELPLIAGQLPILPKHYWQDKDFSETTLVPPLSSGPYKIKSFTAGRNIVYERVEDYWAKDLPVNKGRYNFNEIRYDIYLDDTVLRQALKAGKLDLRQENSAKAWETEYNGALFDSNLMKKEVFPSLTPIVSAGFAFNLRRDKFANREVRKAINLAFDYEWTNRNIFYDQYYRADSYFPSSPFHVEGLPSEAELAILNQYKQQLPDYVLNQPIEITVSDGSGWNRANLIKAAELLKTAGYVIKADQLMDANGNPFVIEFLFASPTLKRILLPLKRNLKILGIDLQLRLLDSAAYQNRLQSFDFDMVYFAVGQSLSPGNEQKEYWGTTAADSPASKNIMGIKNPVVDALTNQIIEASTRQQLITATQAMNRVLTQELYMIPGWHLPASRYVFWNKFSKPRDVNPGVKPIKPGTDFLNWWYDDAKVKLLENARINDESLNN